MRLLVMQRPSNGPAWHGLDISLCYSTTEEVTLLPLNSGEQT